MDVSNEQLFLFLSEVPKAVGTCVIVHSGTGATLYDTSPEEISLVSQLSEALAKQRIRTLSLTLPWKGSSAQITRFEVIENRMKAIKTLLKNSSLENEFQNYLFFGLSAGAQAVLGLLAQSENCSPSPRGAILASCVVESEVLLHPSIEYVELVYGGLDYIAYLRPNENFREMIGPKNYSMDGLKRIVRLNHQKIRHRIFENYTHTFKCKGNPGSNEELVTYFSRQISTVLTGVKNEYSQ